MSNSAIIFIVLIGIVILGARKWDTLKWLVALGLLGLVVYTAFQMGLLDKYIPELKTPKVNW